MPATWPCELDQPPRLLHAWVGFRQPARRQRHHLAGLWQLHIYWHGGELEAVLADNRRIRTRLTPGCITLLPPDATSLYRLPDLGVCTAVHFALDGTGSSRLPFISVQDAATDALHRRIHAACALASRQTTRSAAELWSVLWELASSAGTDRQRGSRLVAQARELIESTLDEPLAVTALARRLEVSPAHLRRLFVAETGLPVKRYQLARRLERARHLLLYSDRRLSSIAGEIGMTDAHQFNKAMRREFGLPPSRLRALGTGPGSP